MSFKGFARQILSLGPRSKTKLLMAVRLLKQRDISVDEVSRVLPELLASGNWEVRNVAIKLAARARDEHGIDLLLDKLLDADEAGIVRRNAAELLAKWGERTPRIELALCRALADNYWEVRCEAARALATLAEPGGTVEQALLTRIFRNGGRADGSNGVSPRTLERNFEVRASLAQALGSLGTSEEAFEALQALANDNDWLVRFQAVVALAEMSSRLPEFHERALRTIISVDHLCSGALPTFVFPLKMGRLIEEMHQGPDAVKVGVLRERYIQFKRGWHRADEKAW